MPQYNVKYSSYIQSWCYIFISTYTTSSHFVLVCILPTSIRVFSGWSWLVSSNDHTYMSHPYAVELIVCIYYWETQWMWFAFSSGNALSSSKMSTVPTPPNLCHALQCYVSLTNVFWGILALFHEAKRIPFDTFYMLSYAYTHIQMTKWRIWKCVCVCDDKHISPQDGNLGLRPMSLMSQMA